MDDWPKQIWDGAWRWLDRIGILAAAIAVLGGAIMAMWSYLTDMRGPVIATLGIVVFAAIIWVRVCLLWLKSHSEELRVACLPEEAFSELREQWQRNQNYGEANYPRYQLSRFPEWPNIEEYSCELFGHPTFTQATWNRLESWLLTHHMNNDDTFMYVISRAEVVHLLREAVAKKA